MTVVTGFRLGAGGSAAAVALVAVFNAAYVDLPLDAEGCFFKGNIDLRDDIFTPAGRIGAAAGRTGTAATEEVTEDIAETAEAFKTAETAAEAGVGVEVGVDTGEAELVVTAALFRVRQDFIGLVDLFELGFRIRFMVDVRMIFRR